MSPKAKLIDIITQNKGLITLNNFMHFCSYDAQYGYYIKQNPIGKSQDFITAAEISQLFGEILGIWLVNYLEDFFKCNADLRNISLIELGPGRGLLMQDILRVLKKKPEILNRTTIHLLDLNEHFIQQQKNNINYKQIYTHSNIQQAVKACKNDITLIIANEFFDTYPIEQYIYDKQSGTFFKKYISVNKGSQDFIYRYLHSLEYNFTQNKTLLPDNSVIEIADYAQNLNLLFKQIKENKGAMLIIDYGYIFSDYQDTLKAIYKHQYICPLTHITNADLSAHVNFGHINKLAEEHNFSENKVTTQTVFLLNYGINIRLKQALSRISNVSHQARMIQSTNRLIAAEQMGHLFKVMSIKQF